MNPAGSEVSNEIHDMIDNLAAVKGVQHAQLTQVIHGIKTLNTMLIHYDPEMDPQVSTMVASHSISLLGQMLGKTHEEMREIFDFISALEKTAERLATEPK